MFSIETKEDVEILKALTKTSNDTKIKELELEIKKLSLENQQLIEKTEQQHKLIGKLNKSLITADQCRDIVFELINGGAHKKRLIQNSSTHKAPDSEGEFEFTETMKREFNEILVEGNQLIHYTVRNQRMDLPITTIELLALVEVYQYRKRKLLNKDSRNICKLYGISKVQFGKLYYNLKAGTFFNSLNDIDNQIKRTNFKLKNGTIHIIEGSNLVDTKITKEMFNRLLNIYANSNQPYATIYKLSKEHKEINPVHLLTILRKNVSVSKVIMESD